MYKMKMCALDMDTQSIYMQLFNPYKLERISYIVILVSKMIASISHLKET